MSTQTRAKQLDLLRDFVAVARTAEVRRRDGAYRLTADSPTAVMLTIRG